jgi:hypothetical protein
MDAGRMLKAAEQMPLVKWLPVAESLLAWTL